MTPRTAALALRLGQRGRLLCCLGRVCCQRRLDFLEGEQQLIRRELLRFLAELLAFQLEQQMVQLLVARGQRVAFGGDLVALRREHLASLQRGQQQGPQSSGISGSRWSTFQDCRGASSAEKRSSNDSTAIGNTAIDRSPMCQTSDGFRILLTFKRLPWAAVDCD
jgi:hypothetical protein